MLSQTSILAIRIAILLTQHSDEADFVRPETLAETLGASPTYTAKVLSALVRAGICESRRGARGGVRLALSPRRVRMLDLVEAAQGALVGDFCEEVPAARLAHACAFHRACAELHQAMVKVLQRWTLAELAAQPAPTFHARLKRPCLIGIRPSHHKKKGARS
ncbi:MAG: RrF2 family transcriptional regulator [Candidatus Sumerlaeaceae bacterium]|jgi:Rrf2 family protein